MFLIVWKRKQLLYDERDSMINYIPFEKTVTEQSIQSDCERKERKTYPWRSTIPKRKRENINKIPIEFTKGVRVSSSHLY